MKIQLVGIAVILFGIAFISSGIGFKLDGTSGFSNMFEIGLVVSFIGLGVTIFGAIKRDKK